ncbi:hypothetical protein P8452_31803 [Trifolium repens]|nr:hypothetical protein P8452_31803 [Trifolium repens]
MPRHLQKLTKRRPYSLGFIYFAIYLCMVRAKSSGEVEVNDSRGGMTPMNASAMMSLPILLWRFKHLCIHFEQTKVP